MLSASLFVQYKSSLEGAVECCISLGLQMVSLSQQQLKLGKEAFMT